MVPAIVPEVVPDGWVVVPEVVPDGWDALLPAIMEVCGTGAGADVGLGPAAVVDGGPAGG